MAAPKVQFVAEYARLTGRDEAEVRQRVRRLFVDGYGPRGAAPISDRTMAKLILGLLGAEQHIDAGISVRHLIGFQGISLPDDAALSELDLLGDGSLTGTLTKLIRLLAEDRSPVLESIEVWWPPDDEVVLCVASRNSKYKLTFGTQLSVAKHMGHPGTVWPEQTVKILSGEVLARLAPLSVPDQ